MFTNPGSGRGAHGDRGPPGIRAKSSGHPNFGCPRRLQERACQTLVTRDPPLRDTEGSLRRLRPGTNGPCGRHPRTERALALQSLADEVVDREPNSKNRCPTPRKKAAWVARCGCLTHERATLPGLESSVRGCFWCYEAASLFRESRCFVLMYTQPPCHLSRDAVSRPIPLCLNG